MNQTFLSFEDKIYYTNYPMHYSDLVGMVGVVIILVAYYLLSVGRWPAEGMKYQVYNLIGAALILFSLCFAWNTASVLMEVAWIGISVIGIIRAMK